MRKSAQISVLAILVLSLAFFIAACSGGGSSSDNNTTPPPTGTTPPAAPTVGTPTSLTTTTEGAQAASAGINVAQQATSSGGLLSGLIASHAPKMTFPFASATPNKTVARLASVVKPMMAKAKAMRSTIMSAGSVTTMTQPCPDGGSQSITLDLLNPSGDITMVSNNCKDGTDLRNGTLSFTGTTITLGTAASPFVDKQCTTTACTSFDYITTAVLSVSVIETVGASSTTNQMTMNGYIDETDNTITPSATDHISMTNFSMTDVIDQTTAQLISGSTATFDRDQFTLNGSLAASHTETGNDYGESDTFQNFTVTTLTDAGFTTAYLSINGTFAVATNPADKCIEGTFAFNTLAPIKENLVTGNTVDGHLTVNGVDIVFNPTGTITVTLGGTPVTYTEAELNGLCALK